MDYYIYNIESLKDGMKIIRDVYTKDGRLIMGEGTVVTKSIIERLYLYDIPEVYVEIESAKADEIVVPEVKISETEKEEIEFKKAYDAVTTNMNSTLNKIVSQNITNDEINETITKSLKMFNDNKNSLSIFGILQEMRDKGDVMYVHSLNVGMIAAMIGKWVNKSEEDIEILMACGLFHDVGKLMVSKDILYKPGKLTAAEFEVMKSHTKKGYQMLKDLDLDERIKKVALLHHEKSDGSGYPFGLRGGTLDEFTKIITIADIYEAMTTTRSYRRPMCPFDVIEAFEDAGFQLYETEFIITFLKNVVNTYINKKVKLTNGQEGVVIMINNNKLSKPIVRVGDEYIDLYKKRNIKIDSIIE